MGDGKAHAKLSASGSSRWLNCPGSVRMEAGIERPSSIYAMEGTAAHELAEICLRNNFDAAQQIGEVFENHEVTQEMADYVQEYLDYVRRVPGNLMVEQRVDFSRWAPEGFGTADAIILDDGTVNVIDLKYGKGVRVDAEENSQAMLYGLGVLNDFGGLYEINKLILTIVQPRLDHVSEYEITTEDLLAFGSKVIKAAQTALSDGADLVPGTTQCRFCAASDRCSALAEYNLGLINEGFETYEDPGIRKQVDKLLPEQIALILQNIDGITKWAKSIEAYAQSLLEIGETVPGYKMVKGRSIRKWIDEQAASKTLVRKLTKKQAFTEKLISVAQAEKLLGKDSKIIKDHAFKPEGKPTLAHESDKREAISVNIADGFDCIDEAA